MRNYTPQQNIPKWQHNAACLPAVCGRAELWADCRATALCKTVDVAPMSCVVCLYASGIVCIFTRWLCGLDTNNTVYMLRCVPRNAVDIEEHNIRCACSRNGFHLLVQQQLLQSKFFFSQQGPCSTIRKPIYTHFTLDPKRKRHKYVMESITKRPPSLYVLRNGCFVGHNWIFHMSMMATWTMQCNTSQSINIVYNNIIVHL